ncbi:MAG: hypothetical protein GQ565_10525 [Candidatus Aegiribacteria sp.]|nr:hypothetical protein [Candidatus Aegiribacteria sp.]
MNRRIVITLILALSAGVLIGSCGGNHEEPQAAQDTTEVVKNTAFLTIGTDAPPLDP